MRLLLDTCTFVWLANNDPTGRLPATLRSLMALRTTELYLSSVSHWELNQLVMAGRFKVDEESPDWIAEKRRALLIESLPFSEGDALQLPRLPAIHRDPFDRMLICQALNHNLILCTPDQHIKRYPIRTLWNETVE